MNIDNHHFVSLTFHFPPLATILSYKFSDFKAKKPFIVAVKIVIEVYLNSPVHILYAKRKEAQYIVPLF